MRRHEPSLSLEALGRNVSFMHWAMKILFSVVCSLLTFVCAVILSGLAIGVPYGSPLLAFRNPFILLGLGLFACHSLWPVCLLFGLWTVFLPPHRRWE